MVNFADVLWIRFARGTSQTADHGDRDPRRDEVGMGGFGCRTSRCSALPTGPPMVRSANDRAHAMAKSNLEKSGEFASVTALLATVQAINQRVRFGARLEPFQSYLQGSAAGNLRLAPPIDDCCACHCPIAVRASTQRESRPLHSEAPHREAIDLERCRHVCSEHRFAVQHVHEFRGEPVIQILVDLSLSLSLAMSVCHPS